MSDTFAYTNKQRNFYCMLKLSSLFQISLILILFYLVLILFILILVEIFLVIFLRRFSRLVILLNDLFSIFFTCDSIFLSFVLFVSILQCIIFLLVLFI